MFYRALKQHSIFVGASKCLNILSQGERLIAKFTLLLKIINRNQNNFIRHEKEMEKHLSSAPIQLCKRFVSFFSSA